MKKFSFCLMLVLFLMLVGCANKVGPSGGAPDMYYPEDDGIDEIISGEEYNALEENPFVYTDHESSSYFSMDSNTAAYPNLRRQITNGYLYGDVIKTDEIINYFSYDLPRPEDGEYFKTSGTLIDAPWNAEHKLLTVGVTTKEVSTLDTNGNNIVFLIDVSGSMDSENKLPLIKKAFPYFLDALSPEDTISVVTYANGVDVKFNGLKVAEKETIIKKVNALRSSGGTAGSKGLEKAYKVAEENFIEGGNNRIIIASDGDFNVGISNQKELQEYISTKLESGIYVTALGFGMGNYKDTIMESIAKYGNGIYAYIDSLEEAKKVLVDDLNKSLVTVAKDVKTKMEFNPEYVESYRLIGYENKQLSADQFEDETTDAGELGSGHQTVVCYELILKDGVDISQADYLSKVQFNFKDPSTDESMSIYDTFNKTNLVDNPGIKENDLNFVCALIEFGLLLRNSAYVGTADYEHIMLLLEKNPTVEEDELRFEFKELVECANRYGMFEQKDINLEPVDYITITVIFENAIASIKVKKDLALTEERVIKEIFGSYEDDKYEYHIALDSEFANQFVPTIATEGMVLYIKINPKQA